MASAIRLFVEAALCDGALINLPQAQAHYLGAVMRRKAGDELVLFNGRDGEWHGRLARLDKKTASVTVLTQTREQQSAPDLWLLFAPIKRAPLDQMAQKATELGVSGLMPVMTERTIVSRVKTDRLKANAIEAAEQTERLDLPEIFETQKLTSLLAQWSADKGGRRILFCDEELADGKEAPTIEQALVPFKDEALPWAILIGPEGGFTDKERDHLKSLPFVTTAKLGPRILRADTAAYAALTLWQAVLGDW
jgi:16S rRNA (uracil1498-N3)-methyltransferase